jgi:sarcosine oxidase subunit beta
MSNSYDTIIIGAGIIGAATALAMARKGSRPLVVDKLPASGYGSTGGSCAIIRPYYSTVDGSAISTGRTGRISSAPRTSAGWPAMSIAAAW